MRTPGLLALVVAAGCGNGGGFIDAPVPTGSFTANWTVQDLTGTTLACDQVDALRVKIAASAPALNAVINLAFPCDQVMAMSQQIAPGTYTMTYELDDGTGAMLATAPEQDDIAITSGGDNILPQSTFVVDDHGGLALTVESGVTGGNCAAGAGITATTVVLTHAGSGGCAPVTFAIGGAGSYTVDCTTPTMAGCIDDTQPLTVSGVTSGTYNVAVHGFKGAADCFDGALQLQVPALQQTQTKTVNLTATNAAGC